jgi:hypothetical protein
MQVTDEQKKAVLPLLQKIVQGIIDGWDAEREI